MGMVVLRRLSLWGLSVWVTARGAAQLSTAMAQRLFAPSIVLASLSAAETAARKVMLLLFQVGFAGVC